MTIFEKYDPYFENELAMAELEAMYIKDVDFDVLFEADQPIQANTIQQNQQQKANTAGHLGNAIEALRKMITGLIARISDWLQKLTMGNKEKQLYDRVVEACKKDPTLANKRITVTDFRASRQEYLKLMKQIEEAEKRGDMSEVDRLIEQIKNGMKGALGGVTVSVGMQAAMNIAQSNREMAAMISQQLQNDSRWLETMKNAVGQKEAQKFQKNIENYTKECRVKRFILGLRGKMFSNVSDAVTDVYDAVAQAVDFNQSKGATKVAKGLKVLGNKTATDMAGRMMQNKEIRSAAKTYAGTKFDMKRGEIQGNIDAFRNQQYQRAEARRRANGNLTNATAFDFLAGGVQPASNGIRNGVNSATQKLQNFFNNT
jgi:hypothetical protein